jgi:hypothetical protein
VRRFSQWLTAALVLWSAALTVAWFTSQGEPVCEGPLILEVDDSDPPQCPDVVEGLLEVGPSLLAFVVFVAVIGSLLHTSAARSRAAT